MEVEESSDDSIDLRAIFIFLQRQATPNARRFKLRPKSSGTTDAAEAPIVTFAYAPNEELYRITQILGWSPVLY